MVNKLTIQDIQKGKYDLLNLVVGEEEYLNEAVREAFVETVLKGDPNDFNYGVYDMEEVSLSVALEEAESLPFFDEKRLIIIENPFFLTSQKVKNVPDHDLDALLAYIENPADFTILLIMASYEKIDQRKKIGKSLTKHASLIETNPLSEKEVQSFVQEDFKSAGFTIDKEAFALFYQLTDGSLTRMMQEKDKLMLYKMDEKRIVKEDVASLVVRSLDQNIFDLNNFILNRQLDKALTLYQDLLLQKEDPIKLIAIMLGQFRILIQVKSLKKKGYHQGEMASLLKSHPYPIKLALQRERHFSMDLLTEAHQQLIETDFKIKTGQVEPIIAFELFMIEFIQTNPTS